MPRTRTTAVVLKSPELEVIKALPPSVELNIAQVKAFLCAKTEEYKSLVFTEDNIESAKLVKKEMAGYRISLDKIEKQLVQTLFTNPKKKLQGDLDELQALIAQVESVVDAALNAEDQKRINELTEIFTYYKDQFQNKYRLDEAHLNAIEFKKQYYNKTASEKESKQDLEVQFKKQAEEQKAEAASIQTIKNVCGSDARLNAELWIKQLAFKNFALVMEEIFAERERLQRLDTQAAPPPAEENGVIEPEVVDSQRGTSVLGIPLTFNFSSDFPGLTKTMSIDITYPVDAGDELTELFRSLKKKGITVKVVQRHVQPETVY
jgi:hypothetical protein